MGVDLDGYNKKTVVIVNSQGLVDFISSDFSQFATSNNPLTSPSVHLEENLAGNELEVDVSVNDELMNE